ncbi:LLM class flavin-dependent oxidoreductase [Tengunoibacter tsumagoiensis]|uniref:N5,N10-methylene tetrahydromethanopterin reductase n=1 Tax=Tengunoibacter tsumagoiensis TaxID=2014871 RepID=A0A402A190_9CHLR|nr:LLM class flavin-dependent oxidoreductase [Tengunoibacter tsumagoiensis]GCE12826.1 N5,N10-methylene tetrahydromethanopterin reductase [Tengunoibacter tsumagoiensis]
MTLPLSLLDLSPVDAGSNSREALLHSIELAQLADSLGYHRYWLAEHHNTSMTASPAPEIMIGHIAQATQRIRVGSGGVMLPNHSPLKVAENFRVLEALHPGRIDLGLGRAPGTDPRTAIALRRSREALNADDFPVQLAELLAFAGEDDGFPAGHPFRSVQATPTDVQLPPIWLLGSSDFSAREAATQGLGFAFAHHINPGYAIPAIQLYRDHFVPSKRLQEPKVILTTGVITAESDEVAEDLANAMALAWLRLRTGKAGPLPTPEEAKHYRYSPSELAVIQETRSRQNVGRPAILRDKLLRLVEQTGADELMLAPMVYGHDNRIKIYELMADAFGIQNLSVDKITAQ